MKIKLDENLPDRLVQALAHLGHDVDTVVHERLAGTNDLTVWNATQDSGRFLITQDLDFSAIVALSGRTAPSVISLRLSSSRVERVNAVLQAVLPGVESAVFTGAIVTVQDARVRVRELPIE